MHTATTPCGVCGTATNCFGTRRCNNCWEVESRLEEYLRSEKGLAVVLAALQRRGVTLACTAAELPEAPQPGTPEIIAHVLPGTEVTVRLNDFGQLDSFAEPGTHAFGFQVRHRMGGGISAAVVGPRPGRVVYMFRVNERGSESISSRDFVESRLKDREQVDGKWSFAIGDATITLALEAGVVVVRYLLRAKGAE